VTADDFTNIVLLGLGAVLIICVILARDIE